MLSPMLILGIGGAGGKTIRAMKQALRRKMALQGYRGELPGAWRFLQIDTTYDGAEFPAPMLPLEEFYSVVPEESNFEIIVESLESLGDIGVQQQLLAGWGIPHSDVAIKHGSGQWRGLGRQVGVADARGILQAIRTQIGNMHSPTAISELRYFCEKFDVGGYSNSPQAFIVSSLGGGSGSGMFLDIAELLKRATSERWASEATSFLYTPEIFDILGPAGYSMSGNSLLALNEITAGHWNGQTDSSSKLFEYLGIPPDSSNTESFGCRRNFLIGRRNYNGIDTVYSERYVSFEEVFLNAGEALANALTDPAITEFLYNRAFVSITNEKMTVDVTGLASQISGKDTLPFAGIGFGRLTLGMDRIVDYVADALTRHQVEKLLWPDLSPELLENESIPALLISEKVNKIWPSFLIESGLDEKGSENQVIDAITFESLHDEINSFATQLIRDSISDTATDLNRFTRNVWSEWEVNSSKFLVTMKVNTQAKAQAWVPSIQKRVIDLLAQVLAVNGYQVTTDLLDRLIQEISNHTIHELRREDQELADATQSFSQDSFADRVKNLAEGLSSVSSNNRDFLNRVRSDFRRVLEFKMQSYICDLAASLLADLTTNFLEPIHKKLVIARAELNNQAHQNKPDPPLNLLQDYPVWGSGNIPARYEPLKIEGALILAEEYEEIYNHYSRKDAGSGLAFEKSAIYSLLGRCLLSNPNEEFSQSLITIKYPWSTDVISGPQFDLTATQVKVNFNTYIVELAEHNRDWLTNGKSTFSSFIKMSIREFIEADENPIPKSIREKRFLAAFSAMLEFAQPQVQLNKNAMIYVSYLDEMKAKTGLMEQTYKIPFSASSDIGKICMRTLEAFGLDTSTDDFEDFWFEPNSKVQSISATSTTYSLPFWAFQPLTESISNNLPKIKVDDEVWTAYWQGRRTRPITESIPISTEIRRSIITGWFIAQLFGLIETETLKVGKAVKIWNPYFEEPKWSHFPKPLLPSHTNEIEMESGILPSLLLSAGLAFVEFGQTGSLEPLFGYRLLKFLGREVTTLVEGRDQWDWSGSGDELPTKHHAPSTLIIDWLESGKNPAESRSLHKVLSENLQSQSNRQGALVASIERLQSEYQDVWNSFSDSAWHELPGSWELKEDIELALSDLRDYAIDSIEGFEYQTQEESERQISEVSSSLYERNLNVFISHATPDKEVAKELKLELIKMGLSPFLAYEDMTPGIEYGAGIMSAIQGSSCLAVILTIDSLKSAHVMREFDLAEESGVSIIPISLLDDSTSLGDLPPSWQYRLKVIQMLSHRNTKSSAEVIFRRITGSV